MASRLYFIAATGNDNNDGCSERTPIKTVARLNQLLADQPLSAGDGIRLRRGDSFEGTLRLEHAIGDFGCPITITGYDAGDNPCVIAPPILSAEQVQLAIKEAKAPIPVYNEAAGEIKNGRITSAIEIVDSAYVAVEDIDGYSTNDGEQFYQYILEGTGIVRVERSSFVRINGGNYRAEVKRRVKDYIADATGADRELIGVFPGWDASYPPYRGNDYSAVFVKNCPGDSGTAFDNIVVEGLCATAVTTAVTVEGCSEFTVKNCRLHDSPCWGFYVNESQQGRVIDCETNHTGFGLNPNGNAAFMVASSRNILFSGLKIIDSLCGPQPYDGVAFDFEGGIDQRGITVRDTLIDGCYGSGMMIFINTDGNRDFLIDNVFIRGYSKDGRNQGALDFCWPQPDNYPNNGLVRRLTVVQNIVEGEPKPFYSLYPSPWNQVQFEECQYIDADDQKSQEEAYALFVQRCGERPTDN